jgi:hypothetical protein
MGLRLGPSRICQISPGGFVRLSAGLEEGSARRGTTRPLDWVTARENPTPAGLPGLAAPSPDCPCALQPDRRWHATAP